MSCKKQSSISDQKGLQMHQERQKMTNFLFDTISENLSLISKELIVQKFQKKMKVQVSELQPYMSPQFGFIDPDFHHNSASINFQEQEQNVEISWIPAEELSEECSYSNQITALDELLFCNKSIDYALMVINWFARDIFLSIFTLQLSKMHLYAFDLMIDGTFVRIAIDSYVPVYGVTNEPLFAKAFKGSIFPCIIEKLLAKVYGDYISITGEFIDIVEMFTYFCREEISCTQGITQQILVDIIQRKLSEDSIVCFRTRNSIRLQSFGLESNHVYIILKIIQTQSDILIEFLQLEGSNWIGKYSKLRSNWRADLAQLASSNEIILEQTQKQNYMSLSDLKGISRELVVLNNTLQFHKNYLVCEKYNSCLTMYELRTDKVNQLQLRTSFRQKKCYNSILVIQRQSKKLATSVPSYNLVASSFHQNKSNNYLQCQIAPGTYWIVVYNTHPQENVLPYHLTVFLSNNFPELRQSQNQLQVLNVLEGAFHNYFNNVYTESKQPVILKHLYESTGLAFIYVRPNENVIEVTLQLQKLKSSKIFPLNIPQLEKDFFKQQFRLQKVLCFYCQWSKKQNIEFQQQKVEDQILKKVAFPPLSSVKVKIKRQNIQYLKHSY